jgi:hypothetical protein
MGPSKPLVSGPEMSPEPSAKCTLVTELPGEHAHSTRRRTIPMLLGPDWLAATAPAGVKLDELPDPDPICWSRRVVGTPIPSSVDGLLGAGGAAT